MDAKFHPRTFLFSGPSGAGKSTVIHSLIDKLKRASLSVSCTTRSPRPHEVDGRDYFFITKQVFRERVEEDLFLEWAQVHDEYYGTLCSEATRILNSGQHAILDIDVQGASIIRRNYKGFTSIFVRPPTHAELRRRLTARHTETPQRIERRLALALEELRWIPNYDHVVLNQEVEQAVQECLLIVAREEQHAVPFLALETTAERPRCAVGN